MVTDWFQIIDPRFRGFILGNVHVEKLATGMRWSEGPVYFGAGRYLLWSDIPNNRMMRWDETDGSVSVFREPSNNTNGHTLDRQGRLVSCEHRGRRVTRTEPDGRITVLADRFEGKRLNSPNDVVVKSDGSIWFTDPPYGILSEYEGDQAETEIGANNVYRCDPDTGEITIAADDFDKPNGLAFSPDERTFYVAYSGYSHGEDRPRHIRAFDVGDDLRNEDLAGKRAVVQVTVHAVACAGPDMSVCVATESIEQADIAFREHPVTRQRAAVVANVTFGGIKKNRLFICGTDVPLFSLSESRRRSVAVRHVPDDSATLPDVR